MSLESLVNNSWAIPNVNHEITFDMDKIPNWVTNFNPIMSPDAEMSWECECGVNIGPGLAKLFGLDLANGSDATCTSMILKSPRQVQVRRHKKKRINKKWNKKFGPHYITTFQVYQLEGVRFDQNGSELTIVGERSRMITPNGPLYI